MSISNSDHITQTHQPECQTPHYNKHRHQISPQCLTHCTTGHYGQLNTHYHQTTCPSSLQLTYDMSTDYNKTDGTFTNYNKAHWTQFTEDTESAFAQTTIPTNIHNANLILTNIILMADNHNIPKGKMHSNCRLLPDHIVCKITQRDYIRRANTCDPALKLLNEEITIKYKQSLWKEHLDAHWDNRHNTHIV